MSAVRVQSAIGGYSKSPSKVLSALRLPLPRGMPQHMPGNVGTGSDTIRQGLRH